ncbi:MAG: aspartate dehydrogenase [FCB group bacterium]|nr:aspartate dehydrogenase [FCB group bacterium]
MARMKVGIVGCGNIGTDLCNALREGSIPAEVVALTDVDLARAESLLYAQQLTARVCGLEENVFASDFVVECAEPSAVKAVVEACIRHKKDCLIMSLGGLLGDPGLLDRARENGILVKLPSGAICGLDGVRSAKEAGLEKVTLTTRKPPKGLVGAPYLVENNIDVENLTEPTVVFEGTALEAVKAFPKNVNVAAGLSLAGVGPEKTTVRVIADPTSNANSHEVVAEGAFGRLCATTDNMPSPRNPKSSYLASLSACAELRAAALTFENRNR